jgi:hypothetical protein
MLVPRAILVLVTAIAAFAASLLQDNVLCYSACGQHVAFEAPHADGGCASGHEGHEHPAPEPDPEAKECTDVSADFPVIREASAASIDAHPVDLAIALPAVLLVHVGSPDSFSAERAIRTHPPAPTELGRLRTIILLV